MDKSLKDAEFSLFVSSPFPLQCNDTRITYDPTNLESEKCSVTVMCRVHPQGQIDELTVENKALMEKLTAEETKRKALAEKSRVLLSSREIHLK